VNGDTAIVATSIGMAEVAVSPSLSAAATQNLSPQEGYYSNTFWGRDIAVIR
ncbi:hypothetical protein A2U01_0082886, partial [Trifolium medium]|nr:hypothetical protein [Trifolium medium]